MMMGLNFGIFLTVISFSCVLLNSPLALCLRTLPPSLAPVSQIVESPTTSPVSFISEPPSSLVSSVPDSAPSSSPTVVSAGPGSSPVEPAPNQFPSLGPMDTENIKKLCDATENPTLCTDTILPFLKGPAGPTSALQTEISSFIDLSEKAIAKLESSMSHPSTSKAASESIQVCLDIYGAAKDDLKQAKEAVEANDTGLLKSMLSGAVTDLGTCEDAFKEGGEEMPLDSDMVATMHKLADNCFDISSAMNF